MLKWDGTREEERARKGKEKIEKKGKNGKQILQIKKGSGVEGKGEEWGRKRRIKMYHTQVHIPYDKCHHFIYINIYIKFISVIN